MSLRMIKDVLKARDISTHCPLCGRDAAKAPHTEEHIFPGWLQRRHDLVNRKLTIPNLLTKQYKSVKIGLCERCNNRIFGALETRLAPAFTSADPLAAIVMQDPEHVALWLGKILWLLSRKTHSFEDYRTRNAERPDRILADEVVTGLLYLAMFLRCFARGKDMHSCFLGDPPFPEYFYGAPFSLYHFEIDERDERYEGFDFRDNPVVGGAAFRTGNLGLVCLFDGGLHRRFRSAEYAYLDGEKLHPMQFAEVSARMFYDQTVLHEEAQRVTYFWNKPLNAVVAMTLTPRSFEPYLQENHDPARLAHMLAYHTMQEPADILDEDGGVFTMLRRPDGTFLPHAVTDAEIEAAKSAPGIKFVEVVGPSLRRRLAGEAE